MAVRRRYSVEQIVARLREAEKLQGQKLTIPQACMRLQISDQTFYRWRLRFGALKEDEVRCLQEALVIDALHLSGRARLRPARVR
jgi:hypothetical protein